MKAFHFFFIASAAYFEVVAAAPDDGVLSGYLMLSDDTKCLGTDGTSVGTPSSTSYSDLDAACIKLYLVEGSAAKKYKIVQLQDKTQKLKLVPSSPPAYVTDGSETEVQFSDGTDLIDATVAGSVTTQAASFLVQLDGTTATDNSCLTDTPEYLDAACGSKQWYFIKVDCTIVDCVTCVDAFTCDNCADGYSVINSETGYCQDCDTAFSFCVRCSDSSGTALCTECQSMKILHSARTSCVDNCTVANCEFCDSDPDTCDTCKDDFTKEGNSCVEVTTTATADDATTDDSTDGGSSLAIGSILNVVLFVWGMKTFTYV